MCGVTCLEQLKNKILQNDQFKKPKRELPESGRFDRDEENVATVLHPKYGAMLLVWKRLRRALFTPEGKGQETGDKDDIHKS